MTTPATSTSVRSTIVVDAPVEEAFTVFTRDIGTWWPPEHHLLGVSSRRWCSSLA